MATLTVDGEESPTESGIGTEVAKIWEKKIRQALMPVTPQQSTTSVTSSSSPSKSCLPSYLITSSKVSTMLPTFILKTLNTIGSCQRPVFSLGVLYKICVNLSSIGCRSCEITMKEKTPLSHEVVCFQMLYFETSKSNSEVWKSNFVKNYFSQKLRHFRGSCFSHCFILPASPHYSLPVR